MTWEGLAPRHSYEGLAVGHQVAGRPASPTRPRGGATQHRHPILSQQACLGSSRTEWLPRCSASSARQGGHHSLTAAGRGLAQAASERRQQPRSLAQGCLTSPSVQGGCAWWGSRAQQPSDRSTGQEPPAPPLFQGIPRGTTDSSPWKNAEDTSACTFQKAEANAKGGGGW